MAELRGRVIGDAVIRVLGGMMLLAAVSGGICTVAVAAGYAWFCIAWLHALPMQVLALTVPMTLVLLAIFAAFGRTGARLLRARAPSRKA